MNPLRLIRQLATSRTRSRSRRRPRVTRLEGAFAPPEALEDRVLLALTWISEGPSSVTNGVAIIPA